MKTSQFVLWGGILNNKVTFEDVVNGKCKKLIIDCIYENKQPNKDMSCRVLPKLMKVQNTGGFRPIGEYKNNFAVEAKCYDLNNSVWKRI